MPPPRTWDAPALPRPLEGVLVIERAGRLAGGVCAMLLLQFGARVIRVEDPAEPLPLALAGEAAGALHAFLEAGRERVAYDPATFARLLDHAQVAICAPPAPGANPDLEAIRARRDRLVGCVLTPYGLAGGAPGMPPAGDELALQAASGLAALTGEEGGLPLPAGVPLAEMLAGVNGATAVLAALRLLERGAGGQLADIALFDGLIGLMGTHMTLIVAGQRGGFRKGCRNPVTAPWNVYPTADARIVVCTSTDDHWHRILKVAGRAELIGDPRFASPGQRVAHVEEVDRIVAAWSGPLGTRSAIARLTEAGVPVGAVRTIPELMADEGFRARGMVRAVTDGRGREITLAGPVFHFSRAKALHPARVEPVRPAGSLALPARPGDRALRAPGEAPSASPLAGVNVVEIAQFTAGPVAARNLAHLGASVVKVEGIEGEPTRRWSPAFAGIGHYFANGNCDKRSLAVDLKQARGREVVARLCARADVLVENQRPGALARLGLGYAELSRANPRLIYLAVSGYGVTGPGAARAAFDTVIQAEAGLMSLLRSRVPVRIGVAIADMMGAQLAPLAILAALRHREIDGLGQHVDLSMQDCAAWLGQFSWPGGAAALPPWHTVEAADGFLIAAAAPARVDAALGGASTQARSCDEIAGCLRAAGIVAEPVRELDAVLDGEQVRRRGLLPALPDSQGTPVAVLDAPYRLERTPARVGRLIGETGADTGDILGELGYTAQERDALRAAGVVRSGGVR
ncbi:MAG: CoA transferase [Candidatus Lambdaproteobacteria bacterium]|nr:CoA transferase [Candidatus Lambdaproteobacteria bacterium]